MGVIDRLLNRPPPPNAFVASAREVRLEDPVDAQKARQWRQAWQHRAFDFYDRVGELSFAVDRQADAIGQVRIFPAELGEDGKPVETDDPKAWDLIDQLEEKQAGGRSEMLRRLGGHITLAGESHLVGIDNNAPEPETNGRVITMPDADRQRFRKSSWEILSTEELVNSGTTWRVSRDGVDRIDLPPKSFVLRIWNPALRHSMLAHSAVRSVLDRLEELVLLGDEVAAISKSRVSAGGLKLPSEAKFPQREGEDPDKDPFVEDLIRHMTAPIGDTRSGEAVIPLVIRAAAEHLKDIGPVELGRTHDERDVERRREVIERIATGLDWPKELLLGISSVNHWNAFFLGDQAFKGHTEPKLQLICSSLTAGYLRPGLEAAGVEDASRFLVWYDAAAANVEPDRTDDATKGVQNGALSWKAWRDATGWTDEDAPDLEELEIRAALIGQSLPVRDEEITPESVKGPPDQEESERRAEEPVTAAATPRTKTMGRQLAALERQTRERLAVSADAAARRALEKAGARLRSKFAGNAKKLGLQDALRGVKNPHVASHLGPEKVHALGLEEDDLMEDAANDWAAQSGGRIRAAQRRMGVIVMDDPESADDRGARETAVGLLAGGFLAFLKEALYSPTVDMPTVGEFDGLMAPRKLIAQSLTIAGGGGVPDRELVGLTGGRIATELLAGVGVKVTGYIWIHGAPDRPFPAHEELDGVSFTNWEDDVLLVQPGDEWIGLTHYAPLDHPACQCSEELILEEDEATT